MEENIEILEGFIGRLNQDVYFDETTSFEYLKQPLENVLNELEKKDKKLEDIEKHIKAEIMMIEKTYNEVNLFTKQQYDGMMASYKCLLNVFFSEVKQSE